jgi:hypothetical protein
MALDKLRLANKKARREHKRRQVRALATHKRRDNKVRAKRAREIFLQGRKEYQAKRRANQAYVDSLETELANEG